MNERREERRQWEANSPEWVVLEAFAAVRARDGSTLARLSSSASLEAYREHVRRELNPQWHPWTVEALLQHQPEMPEAVARWQLQRMDASNAAHIGRVVRAFGESTGPEELEGLDPASLLVRALGSASAQLVESAVCEPIGHVVESPDRVYVLCWVGAPIRWFPEPTLATLIREEGRWKLELDPHTRCGLPGFRNVAFVEEVIPPHA